MVKETKHVGIKKPSPNRLNLSLTGISDELTVSHKRASDKNSANNHWSNISGERIIAYLFIILSLTCIGSGYIYFTQYDGYECFSLVYLGHNKTYSQCSFNETPESFTAIYHLNTPYASDIYEDLINPQNASHFVSPMCKKVFFELDFPQLVVLSIFYSIPTFIMGLILACIILYLRYNCSLEEIITKHTFILLFLSAFISAIIFFASLGLIVSAQSPHLCRYVNYFANNFWGIQLGNNPFATPIVYLIAITITAILTVLLILFALAKWALKVITS
ncbi:MAG: hypothetical protein JW727_03000 [Candidatus Aenigmarchaeota archaeon]|nr:hypothetical protein [Candidatus Aenigmarchaeota archaeon]